MNHIYIGIPLSPVLGFSVAATVVVVAVVDAAVVVTVVVVSYVFSKPS